MNLRTQPVAIVGGGAWGVALAAAAARSGPVVLVSRRPQGNGPGHLGERSSQIRTVSTLSEVASARLIVLAVPSMVAADVVAALAASVDGSHYVVHGVRGLVGRELETISDLLRTRTAVRRVGALGGPALAEDLLQGKPSVLVAGSRFREVNIALRETFASSSLRLYATADLLGLEWASALVGCLAIAIGFARGSDASPGLIAALICRAMGEAARLALVAGGDERTLLGLAGYGDLLASIEQPERPEVKLGLALSRGLDMDAARAEAKERIEAIELIPRVVQWASEREVRVPILQALCSAIQNGKKSSQVLAELMTLPLEEGV
jgi:glycerol-3-phosphate dehydrogenase (NAD(P)+)